ncbi:hypothetical protein CHLNCDRAFT_140437 [Chlorella variabilis]|uniref:Uncharacterized protein n=1 Tax=Chlorella variabilis TaxID=554065 RepID=E1Z716_CHLVA|nr:hypothetical protein CHLNCDRAFT_140437 [Chlorella variabilis]EFN58741.1 hypothetical protein CHLNCDRAFT_140437 [Chlorella variabilis]|eukprot:XP_005850843.1 hypothetical protein CHLNCDRAFT_140437 [Chlorella variabilis]
MAFNATTLLSVLLAATAQLHALPQGEDHGTAPAPLPLLSGNNATDWPQFRVIRDLETLWEVPDQVGGVLLVAHGCSHQAGDFWPASQRCPGCLGLPEEMAIRATALRRGYAVIAVSSYNRSSGCWHNTQASRSEDLQRLPDIVREVVREEGLEGLPLFLFGASSGGGIVLRLAAIMAEVQGVAAQVVPFRPDLMEGGQGWRRFPPVVVAHMAARDPVWAAQVAETMGYCRSVGIPAAEIRIDPQPITPQFLQRAPQIDRATAEAMVEALDGEGLLDEPLVGGMSLEVNRSPVAQLLNELPANTWAWGLAWLEAGGQLSLEEVQRVKERWGEQRGG